jgi:cytochrome c oxidase cbb3-type subunit III
MPAGPTSYGICQCPAGPGYASVYGFMPIAVELGALTMPCRHVCTRRMRQGLAFTLAAALALCSLVATAATPPGRERGRAIYTQYCAVCHGATGRADTPVGQLLRPHPRNFADPVEMARVSADRVLRAIKEGRPGTAMASWAQVLSEAEMGDVMDHVLGLVERPPTPLSAEQLSVASGKRTYDRECASCHGLDGQPPADIIRVLNPAPRVFADPVEMARVDEGRMYLAIYRGRPGTAMGGRGELLGPTEIVDLMRYVRKLARPLPAGMTPAQLDRQVGELIYRQHCIGCHGERGNGHTPLGEQLSPMPFDFTNGAAMGATSDAELSQVILHGRPGTAMASWQGVLNQDDVRRVLSYIRQTFAAPRR